jgi:hypothetical protein
VNTVRISYRTKDNDMFVADVLKVRYAEKNRFLTVYTPLDLLVFSVSKDDAVRALLALEKDGHTSLLRYELMSSNSR